jgi:hypothetical protein
MGMKDITDPIDLVLFWFVALGFYAFCGLGVVLFIVCLPLLFPLAAVGWVFALIAEGRH